MYIKRTKTVTMDWDGRERLNIWTIHYPTVQWCSPSPSLHLILNVLTTAFLSLAFAQTLLIDLISHIITISELVLPVSFYTL